ncbi:conserved hypothetical protein [Candidatus Sulfopaludibacter sp. SbA3]|nr:conserved hypothetical protein [Candidatus Sulfopaludibacter sp. SbA3]
MLQVLKDQSIDQRALYYPERMMPTFWRRALLVLSVAAIPAPAQQAREVLARLDRFAPTFLAAKASIRSVTHTAVIDEDETELGTFAVKRYAPGKLRFLIAFTGENAKTVVIDDQLAQIYYPKIPEIQEYNTSKYRDLVQKLLLLGFGTAGRDIAASYEVRELGRDSMESQPASHLELIPKSVEVRKQVNRVELWIAEGTQCPVQQTFHYPDGGYRKVTFLGVQLNPTLPASTFDLPKNVPRKRMN